VQLSTPDYTAHLANSVYACNTQQKLIKYYHAALFSPTKTTLIKAAQRGYLQGWPGLTQAAINKRLENSEATIKGHLNQVRKGVRSTPVTEEEEIEQSNEKTNYIFASIDDLGGTIYTDQTGRFPRVSSRGMKYIMVCYAYDCNFIEAIPLKNRSNNEFQRAYE
jgi:hypothetical protein